MTCIVGYKTEDAIYIGGDSAGVGGDYSLSIRTDDKVFLRKPFIFGFTTSFRMGQLLHYSLEIPERSSEIFKTNLEFMNTDFIDAVRACLKKGGFAKIDNNQDYGGSFLVGYNGELYEIGSDYQVGIPSCGYAAIGSGGHVAEGAMFALMRTWIRRSEMPPELLVETALRAAESHNAGVRGPFKILKLET